MPAMRYDSDDLRSGAGHGRHAASLAGRAAESLDAARLPASAFGGAVCAAALHGAITEAWEHHRGRARSLEDELRDGARRAHLAAALADEHTATTTRLARGGTP